MCDESPQNPSGVRSFLRALSVILLFFAYAPQTELNWWTDISQKTSLLQVKHYGQKTRILITTQFTISHFARRINFVQTCTQKLDCVTYQRPLNQSPDYGEHLGVSIWCRNWKERDIKYKNQSINQSMDQWTKQPINRTINQAMEEWTNPSINESKDW